MQFRLDRLTRTGCMLILGGALGNMIDRFFTGYVVDMVELLFVDFAVFNVADVALMNDDISKVPYLKWLGKETIKTIHGAISLSMCINFAAVTLSVLGVLNPTTGALVHNAGSCLVVLLATLLYDKKYRQETGE